MKPLLKIIFFASLFICLTAILISCRKKTLPEVTTEEVTGITATSAISGGNVANNGGAEVTARGVYWGTSQNPESGSNKTSNGTGNGTFTSNITGLTANTLYYVKAYATNSEGTNYGNEVTFYTICPAPSAPVVGTIIQPTCALTTGSVVLNGLPSTGTWTLTRTPGGATTSGTGTTMTISGLPAGTTYTFTVTNASGCISSSSNNIVINPQPATPLAPVIGTITQPTCAVTTGSVVLSGLPSSGTWTLTRTQGGTTTSGTGTSTTISGLPAGATYNFSVTNASGCVSALSGNIVINPQPTTPPAPAIGTITQPTCAVTTGSVFLSGLPSSGNWTLTRYPGEIKSNGSGSTTTVLGLPAGTTYNFTVTNSSGCVSAVSASVAITPQPTAPAATTGAYNVSPNEVVISGTVNAHYATSQVIFEYGTTTGYGNIINATPYQVTGSSDTPVNATLTGLIPNTHYYYRVTATNCAGPTYAVGKDFTTPPINSVTDNDGNTYNVITIGSQVWMAENLKTTTYRDGNPITPVTDGTQWANLTSEAYCWYDNNITYKNTYGALYNWYAVNTGKLCPTGWHVPTDTEWTVMENFLITNGFNYDGSTTVNKIAKSLAATTNWNSSTNIGAVGNTDFSGKRNVTGFTALPSGYRISDGSFSDIRNFDGWWSSTESNTTLAWSRNMYYDYSYTYRDPDPKRVGFSIRCVRD